MPLLPPAEIGMALDAVDTPALIIDLDAFERNLAKMAATVTRYGVRLRPHAKTHKSPIIARRQMDLGAVGVCCQKPAEAEVMVAGGIENVLVSNEVVGAAKLARLANLARSARIGLCFDDPGQVRLAGEAAAAVGTRLDALVEIDVGGRRCGVAPGEAAARLAERIAAEKHLRFAGLQAYFGSAQHKRAFAEREAAIASAARDVAATLKALGAVGLKAETVGGGGTGTFELEAASGLWNELQPGSYIFMDVDYAKNEGPGGGRFDQFEHALFVYATVISTNGLDRAVIDAGHKAVSNDSGFPDVVGLPGARYHRPSDEHGVLDVAACASRPAVGDKLLLIPGHCDPTINLYDWYVGVRGLGAKAASVAEIWPVAARGAVT